MIKKTIFILLILLIFSVIITYLYLNNKENNNELTEVILDKCVDGDTAWFKIDDKVNKYRFLAIDTKELNTDFGELTKNYVCELLSKANTVEIKYDEVGKLEDKYNRKLVWVYIDGVLIQEKLIKEGFAEIKYIYANYDYLDNLIESENYAKENKLGIWKNYNKIDYNKYYTVTYSFNNESKEYKVLKNTKVILIENPKRVGCKFIGWKNNNYLFDLSTKINKDYKLEAVFDC